MDDIRATAEIILATYRYVLIGGVVLSLVSFIKANTFYRTLVGYLCIMGAMEFTGYFLGYILKVSNHIIVLLAALADLVFFLYLYKRFFFKKKNKFIMAVAALGILYILFEIHFNFIYTRVPIQEFQPYAKPVSNIVVILLTLTFLYERISTYSDSKLDKFAFNNVVLIYFTLNTIIYLPFNFLVNENSGVKFYFWSANVILILLFYMYLTMQICKNAFFKRVDI